MGGRCCRPGAGGGGSASACRRPSPRDAASGAHGSHVALARAHRTRSNLEHPHGGPVRMTLRHPERLGREHRLRASREFREVQTAGTAYRGRYCTLLALARAGERTRFGFIASRRSVGNAVCRNRARRRLREIIRRRFPRMPHAGYWIVVIAHRDIEDAAHATLASEVEHLLARAGALAPIEPVEV